MAQAVSVLDGEVNRNWNLEDSRGERHLLTLFHDTVTGARAAMLDYEEVPGSAGTTNLFNLVAGRVNIPFSVTHTEDSGRLSIVRRGLAGFSYQCELNGKLVLDTTAIVQNPENEYDVSMPASVDVGNRISGITWYEMHATRKQDGKGTLVHRRFRDFVALHEQVESLMKGHHLRSSLPRFPGKKSKLWTNHGDLSFVEDRRKSLEQYMKTLLRLPHVSTLDSTRAFLGLVGNLREFSVIWEGKELGAVLKRASDVAGGAAGGGGAVGGGGGPPVVRSVLGHGKSPPGVCPGDRLFRVNGESTEMMTLEAAFSSVKSASRPVLLHFLGPILRDATVATLPEAFLRRRLPDKQSGHTPVAADNGPPLAGGLLRGGGAGAIGNNVKASRGEGSSNVVRRAGNNMPFGRPMRPFGDGSSAAGRSSLTTNPGGLFGGRSANSERPEGEAHAANAWRDSGGELNRPARPLGDRYGGGGTKGGPSGWMPDMTIGAGAASNSSSEGAARWAIPPAPAAAPVESTRGHTGNNTTSFPGGPPPVQRWDRNDDEKSDAAFPTGGAGVRSGALMWPERLTTTPESGSSFGGARTGHVRPDNSDRGGGGGGMGGAAATDGLVAGRKGGGQRQGAFGASTLFGLDGSSVSRGEGPVVNPFPFGSVAVTSVDDGDEEDEEENPFA